MKILPLSLSIYTYIPVYVFVATCGQVTHVRIFHMCIYTLSKYILVWICYNYMNTYINTYMCTCTTYLEYNHEYNSLTQILYSTWWCLLSQGDRNNHEMNDGHFQWPAHSGCQSKARQCDIKLRTAAVLTCYYALTSCLEPDSIRR